VLARDPHSVRVYLVPRGDIIHPFDVRASDCPIGGRTLADDRAQTLKRLKADVTEADLEDELEGPALVLADDVWATHQALKLFLGPAKKRESPARLALPTSGVHDLLRPLQDVDEVNGAALFDVAWLPAGQRATPAALFALEDHVAVALKELIVDVPTPKYILGRDEPLQFPLSSTVVMRVRHWVHVLRAGHIAPAALLLDRARRNPLAAALRALLGFRLGKLSRDRALRAAFVHKGKRCFIHPTATVEASILGDDVTIGAYSYVTGSVLGDRVRVEQRAHVEQSCLGADTFVSKNSSISACVSFADTDVCTNGIQACVVGPRCGLTSFARPLDLVPGERSSLERPSVAGGEVQVLDGGELRGAGPLPCGVAFGPEVFVGADVVIAPGRAIPRGVRLVGDPDRALRRPPEPDAGTGTVRDGRFDKLS
jgi:hypothetical protein